MEHCINTALFLLSDSVIISSYQPPEWPEMNNKIMRLYIKTTNHKYRLLFSKPGMNKQTTLCNSLFSTMKGFIAFSVALEKYN